MIKVVLLAAALAVSGVAQAQGSSAAKKELVAKVLQLQQGAVEGMARQLTEQPAMMLMQQAGPMVQRQPAERREALARDIEADVRKYVEEATPIVRERALKLAPTTLGPLLDERFSEDELKQVAAFLESAAIRKYQQLAPEMQRALGEKLVAETREQVEAKVRVMQDSVNKRLGVTAPPAASGAKPAPAPAPATKK